MGKLDDLAQQTAGNIDDSIGVGRAVRPADSSAVAAPARWQGVTKSKNAAEIPADRIDRDPNQPREEFDEDALARLASSLKTRGLLQPIRVRWDEGRGVYLIVCGERRWRAAKMAGLATVSAIVMDRQVSPDELLALQMIENCVREDLRPVEQARAYKTLIERNGWTVRQAAEELAVNHSAVVRSLALLDLPVTAQSDIERGTLLPSAAYEIAKVDDQAEREQLARRAVEEKLTYAEVKAAREQKSTKPRPRKLEHKDRNGCTVIVTVPDGLDDEDAFAAHQRALKEWRKARARSDAA